MGRFVWPVGGIFGVREEETRRYRGKAKVRRRAAGKTPAKPNSDAKKPRGESTLESIVPPIATRRNRDPEEHEETPATEEFHH